MLFGLALHLLQMLCVINYSWDIPVLGEHKYKTLHKSSLLSSPLSSCILTFKLQESEKFFFHIFWFQKRCSAGYLSGGWTISFKYVPMSPCQCKKNQVFSLTAFWGAAGKRRSPQPGCQPLPHPRVACVRSTAARWIAMAWCLHLALLVGNSSTWMLIETLALVGVGPQYTVWHGDLGLCLIPKEEWSVDTPHCKNGRKSCMAEPVWQDLAQLKWPSDMPQWWSVCGQELWQLLYVLWNQEKCQSFVIIWLQV